MAVLRLTHVGICVADLERSLSFYRDGLGFMPLSSLELGGEPAATLLGLSPLALRAAYLERDGMRIELLHYPQPGHRTAAAPRPMNRTGLTHLSVRVDDLEATLAALVALGGTALAETRITVPAHGSAAVFVTDPDGTRIELVQAPGDPAAPPGIG